MTHQYLIEVKSLMATALFAWLAVLAVFYLVTKLVNSSPRVFGNSPGVVDGDGAQWLNLESFVEEISEMLQIVEPTEVRYSGHLRKMRVQREPLFLVLKNLILNSAVHGVTPENPIIEVKAIELNGAYRIEVADRGVGIDPEFAPKLFHMFAKTEESCGRGLGLAMVKQTVESVGGSISVDSALDQGTAFRIVWPFQC